MEMIGLVEETLARVDSLITDDTMVASHLRDELRRLLTLQRDIKEEALRPKVTKFSFLPKRIFNLGLKFLNQSLDTTDLKATALGDLMIPKSALDPVRDLVLDDPIIGREADASKILNLLTRSSHQRVLTVVPIVGMAGLGKTALAKLVSQQPMALNLFDVKLWVCVSDKCDELKILGQMLRSMGGLAITNSKDSILQQLETELERKRFLLVLDDVWEDVSSWWDDFRTRLLNICKHNGNVVLVTTRSEKLASIVETSYQYRHTLDLLFDDECWLILKARAFRNVTEEGRSYLQAMGKEIAKKSRGVPLSANVLGGTLGFIRGKVAWSKIRDSPFLKARDIEESVKSILKLSFDHLPSSMKSCFALCSVLPKGFLIVKEDLIHMWMAERFVDSLIWVTSTFMPYSRFFSSKI